MTPSFPSCISIFAYIVHEVSSTIHYTRQASIAGLALLARHIHLASPPLGII